MKNQAEPAQADPQEEQEQGLGSGSEGGLELLRRLKRKMMRDRDYAQVMASNGTALELITQTNIICLHNYCFIRASMIE